MRDKRKGHPPRLKCWDYSWPGGYFVTFVVKDGQCCLSTIEADTLQVTEWGEIVRTCWLELPIRFPQVVLDEIVTMPNHVHAIIILTDQGATPGCRAFIYEGQQKDSDQALINQGPTMKKDSKSVNRTIVPPLMSDPRMLLGKVIRAWKAKCTRLIHQAGNSSFTWQARYYEHIIRNEQELSRIREYIAQNPARWTEDKYYLKPGSESLWGLHS